MTARSTDEALDLDAIEARTNAATPGPWAAADEHGNWNGAAPAWCVSRMHGDEWLHDVFYHASQSNGPQAQRDSEFVAHARADVPALVAEVRELRDSRERAIRWAVTLESQLAEREAEADVVIGLKQFACFVADLGRPSGLALRRSITLDDLVTRAAAALTGSTE